ncbi:hypothetical protein BASA60_007952 [Batrachochytrium salamandrivorans]|nr:hypothetical protein BASA60_007952 [Batrachochytrium salamandrivorans]
MPLSVHSAVGSTSALAPLVSSISILAATSAGMASLADATLPPPSPAMSHSSNHMSHSCPILEHLKLPSQPPSADHGNLDGQRLSRMDSSVVISAYDYTATVLPVSASSDVSRSTLSIDDLCDSISYTTDEDVQLAVEALGGLRNSGSHPQHMHSLPLPRPITTTTFDPSLLSHHSLGPQHHYPPQSMMSMRNVESLSSDFNHQISLSTVPIPSSDSSSPNHPHLDPYQHAFFSRVSNILPLVNSSISTLSTVYEATKNASSVVKYSAESVESGVKNIARPVFDTLEPALTPLGRFACNQLDRLERSVPYIFGSHPRSVLHEEQTPRDDFDHNNSYHSSADSSVAHPLALSSITTSPQSCGRVSGSCISPKSPLLSDSAYDSAGLTVRTSSDDRLPPAAHYVERKPKSRLHQVVLGVGVSMGVLSTKTLRVLKYCLQFLQHAINNVERQIAILSHYLFNSGSSLYQPVSGHDISRPTVDTLSNIDVESAKGNLPALIDSIKRDVVETVRTAVEMVSRHAAVYLPGDARQSVRAFILDLPSRLASLTRSPSPEAPQALHGETAEAQEAQNVLTLASESSAMLKGIESVFSRTVELSERMLEPVAAPETSSVAMSPSLSNAGSPKYYNLHNGNSTNAMRRCRLRTSSRVSTAADGDAEYDSQMMDMDDPEYLPASIDTSTKMGSRKSMDMEQ